MKEDENNSVDLVDGILQTPLLHATPPDDSKRDITFDFHTRKIVFTRKTIVIQFLIQIQHSIYFLHTEKYHFTAKKSDCLIYFFLFK